MQEYVSIFNPVTRQNYVTECGKIEGSPVIEVDNNTVEIWFQSAQNRSQYMRGFQLEFEGNTYR